MLITDSRSSNFVELVPTRYQFPEVVGDEYDDNWLMIRGHVRLGDDEWSFEEPSLLVEDAGEIGLWLRRVSAGKGQVSLPDEAGKVSPQLFFLEPNLAMALVARDRTNVTLRLFFSHESGIPDLVPLMVKSRTDAVLDLVVTREDVQRAAHTWSEALLSFPERTVTGRSTPNG
jgi:hypothetical protein